MVKQYPDHIIVTWTGEPIKDRVSGNYTPGEDKTFESDCRIEANTSSRKIQGSDGSMMDYAFDVFMPKASVIIPDFEAEFILTGGSVGELKGKVKRAKNNQMNSRIWL